MSTARIFDIYRGTTHDGPGVRSTVFFAGCPLRCAWCHNPEGIAVENRVWWEERSCIGCMLCTQACVHGAKQAEETGIVTTSACTRCGACVAACPTKATAFVWKEWTLEKLVDEVRRDRAYYERTGGGVTASGGECLLQPDFVASFFETLQAQGISTALDTCGHVKWEAIQQVLQHTDIVLYDLKLMDAAEHERHVGVGNSLILENARRIARTGKRIWIRTPLIPGATATQQNLRAIAAFIRDEMGGSVERWELCAFNNHCLNKYQRLQMPWTYENTPLLTAQQAQELRAAALECGLGEENVIVTGMLAE